METIELLKKVRRIEIKARGLSKHIFAGQYHSAFKGRGIAFSEVREYQYGDDIRNIDWNVTARFNHPYVKVYEEERELTVMLLVDVSGSGMFGTTTGFKREVMTEIAAVLSFSAILNNDKTGVILFSNKVEKIIRPQKGSKHILRIIRELLDFEPENKNTNLNEPLRYLTNAIKKRCTAFIISDFIAPDFDESLRIAANKHDIAALKIFDPAEKMISDLGLVRVCDPETGLEKWVDTSLKKVREEYSKWWESHTKTIQNVFRKAGVDSAWISTGEDYVQPLIRFFKKRQ
ncbi:MAG TPA: DUF58 domain-containing protein [Bacteroidales bacterium]|nr:DUF58 domain-containing protein [Bacteroidales bacterium]HCI56089.1 DUF58 domain-containing protein [Bacteroidales bacterium]HOU95122.1 DUF58 domain-containing protein [Bacteroidales bacterium]HQG36388.1 DUF58 domain-containing protein [Bacteroidales bacterium]HQG53715.1 DUF58 domain-containing protein [Bacteroidales bacterium]